MPQKLMLDLCCGLKGASQAMRERGWRVLTVDIDGRFEPDVVADVRDWHYEGERPDLVWASPPCAEFSREYFPWTRTGVAPDLSVYLAVKRVVDEVGPVYWIIENVRGAVPYFGTYTAVYYPYYLWGVFPPLGWVKIQRRHKESYPSTAKALRSKIPYGLSLAVARAIEGQAKLL
jgi:hypothetical protein